MIKSVMFSINDYDHEGDIFDEGVFIHLDGFRFKIGRSEEDIESFKIKMLRALSEAEENL